MESVLLLLLLFSIDRNPALKDGVADFLRFYRENRDLIGALVREPPRTESAPEDRKNRPRDGVGDILEEYLRRMA